MLAGECQQENTKWIDPEHDKVSHAVRQGVGLSRAGPRDQEEGWAAPDGSAPVLHGSPLLRI
jgi:hypothetical protein